MRKLAPPKVVCGTKPWPIEMIVGGWTAVPVLGRRIRLSER
jgi:hypothetical protein